MKTRILLIILYYFSSLTLSCQDAEPSRGIDTLEFQPLYPNDQQDALGQLRSFPAPRYKSHNTFIPLFNWMSTRYMAGGGDPAVTESAITARAVAIQEELILHWNYFLTIQNSNMAADARALDNPKSMISSYIALANKYPEVPLGITTFWVQMKPPKSQPHKVPGILRKDHPDSFYIKDASGKVIKRVLNFAVPDSIFIADGNLQKIRMENILSRLTRPVNLVNENGEEPPGVTSLNILSGDRNMIAEKEKLGISSWKIYAAEKKKHFRNLYASQFMSLKGMEKAWFTVYAVEGGPIDRFDWNASKKTCSAIKGNYYSTPDFYPRTPDNWKKWKGPWHGWKWINDGRKVEIKSGDRFFSPFIAAGWSANPEKDIRPAQWLGLLKCLSVVGAEFYYTGYFNLQKPFSDPKDYIWQAAIPSYSQAISTYYADVFFQGNVLSDARNEPLITYPVKEEDVLVAVRKHDSKEKYVIAATVQPTSNTGSFPLSRNIELSLGGDQIIIKARRQGSVYIYDKSVSPALFYQLDRWHQYEHPSRWRKYWINEAEVFDSCSGNAAGLIRSVYPKDNKIDLTAAESYIQLGGNDWAEYRLPERDREHLKDKLYVMIFLKAEAKAELSINGSKHMLKAGENWRWVVLPLPAGSAEQTIRISASSGSFMADKIIITDTETVPGLDDY